MNGPILPGEDLTTVRTIPTRTHTMTDTTKKFLVQGCHTQHDRYDVLAYMADSKAEAYAKCKELHPQFDVYSVSEAAPDQY